MQIAFVILAHKDPLQLKRLVLRLVDETSLVLIHVDRKVNLNEFKGLAELPNVHLVKHRIDVRWGGFSQVKAVVNSFKELLEINPDVDYVNLISGQDYPIKPLRQFLDFLKKNPKKAFMEFLTDGHWVVNARERFNKYHFSDSNFFGKFKIEKLITSLLPKRRFPKGFELVGKSQWFTIDNECLKYIVGFISKEKRLYRKFKYSWGADELVFQTILYNSPLKDKLVNNNLRYIDWSENKSSPKTLTMQDAKILTVSNEFFARKFDISIDNEILDLLDS